MPRFLDAMYSAGVRRRSSLYSMRDVISGRHGSVLVRATIVRLILEYWARRGADWMPHEGMILDWVDRHGPSADERTVRNLLHGLVHAKILRCRRTPRNVFYQLPRQFADPNWPGFAPEVDDLLIDPLGWVDADGTFFRIGKPNPPFPHIYVVPTYPHYFAQHLWTRGWLHALNNGYLATPQRALELIREAVREAPMHMLWRIHEQPQPDPALLRLRKVFAATPLRRRTRSLANEPWPTHPTNAWQKWIGWTGEAALQLLHAACGHLKHGLHPDAIPKHPHHRLDETTVYELLDQSVRERLIAKAEAEPAAFLSAADEFYGATMDMAWN